jgi:hypothetical protein
MILRLKTIKNQRKLGKEYIIPYADGNGGSLNRHKYDQKVIITYIEVDCYEHNFKYGRDKNLLQKAYQKL